MGCWIVKDMSRFGRDYLTVGQYTEIIFPSYDVRFIAVNDGVDSNRGDSEGITAIRNLFNEWYPRDTSKKVRVSLRQRGTSGKHMGKPPYGYRRDPEDKEQWILDEDAAPVVKRIFDLTIAGKGPSQIARILERDEVLTAKALYARRKGKPLPDQPYHWGEQSIVGILERMEYTGCVCNFKTYSKSYKLKKRIPNKQEDMFILPTHRRPSYLRAMDRCRSCGRTNAAPRKRNGRDFSPGCSTVRTAGASCTSPPARASRANKTTMYARNTKAVAAPVRRTTSGRKRCGMPCWSVSVPSTSISGRMPRAFRRNGSNAAAPIRSGASGRIRSGWRRQRKRLADLDVLISRCYEDSVLGNLSMERYKKMSADYEAEQER